MIDICFDQGSKLDIQFNPSKSCLFKIGPGYNQLLPNLHIGNKPIFGADKLKYLGVYFDSGKMININILPIMRKFYVSANSILCHSKYVSELTKLSLFESFALPVLMYSLDVLFLDPVQIRKLNVCWNNIYRRIFIDGSLLKFYS